MKPSQLERILDRLHLEDGDVIVVRGFTGDIRRLFPITEAIALAAKGKGIRLHDQVIVLNPNESIETLSDQQLSELGLQRKGALLR